MNNFFVYHKKESIMNSDLSSRIFSIRINALKERIKTITYKAPNFGAAQGEVISGNLGRGEGGKFANVDPFEMGFLARNKPEEFAKKINKMTMDMFEATSSKFDWIYHVNSYVNPNAAARRDIKLKIPHWTKMFDHGKRVGFIYGIDKPRVNGLNGKYYFKFADMIDNSVSAECQMLDREWEFNELFYWTPDNFKIVIKQGHTVKNYLKSVTEISPFIIDKFDPTSTVSFMFNKKIHWLTSPGLHTLIYPRWTQALYQLKPASVIFTDRDTWFFNLSDSDPAKYAWRVGFQHRWKSTPDFFKRDILSLAKGFKLSFSNPYFLGT